MIKGNCSSTNGLMITFFHKQIHLFLTFMNKTVAVWIFCGELVTSFEDHLLWHADYNTNSIYITSDQDLIISYCKAEEGCSDEGEVFAVGSINMSNILVEKCIAKISTSDVALQISPRRTVETGRSSIRSTVRDALEDVTALYYDEDRNEIYTGNKQVSHLLRGLIHSAASLADICAMHFLILVTRDVNAIGVIIGMPQQMVSKRGDKLTPKVPHGNCPVPKCQE
ncbi:hypothetical protein Cni_G01937 [Canna indica]|uniref:Uncharacterized protein n=1 Tax=Canna indica TaxID=4628 RepID=A0AAQ3JQ39_9LILI|nr:hypothetical protein Cni_G01937 [Canna indica]